MPSRRGPRPVLWPAKLLWAPCLLVGLFLMIQPDVRTDKVSDGGWRVISTITTPDQWVQSPSTFWPGLFLCLFGIILVFAYTADIDRRGLSLAEYPWFTAAAWVLGLLALMAWFRTTGHVAEVGASGIDWRFLAYMRTEILDYVLFALAAAGCLACWVASWGRPVD